MATATATASKSKGNKASKVVPAPVVRKGGISTYLASLPEKKREEALMHIQGGLAQSHNAQLIGKAIMSKDEAAMAFIAYVAKHGPTHRNVVKQHAPYLNYTGLCAYIGKDGMGLVEEQPGRLWAVTAKGRAALAKKALPNGATPTPSKTPKAAAAKAPKDAPKPAKNRKVKAPKASKPAPVDAPHR